KHGERVNVVNLYSGELGNAQLPEKFRRGKRWKMLRPRSTSGRDGGAAIGGWAFIAVAVAIIGAVAVGVALFFHRLAITSENASLSKSSPFPASAIPEKSIAVLPFENRSDEKQNAYFADGVQNEILTDLAKIADLRV